MRCRYFNVPFWNKSKKGISVFPPDLFLSTNILSTLVVNKFVDKFDDFDSTLSIVISL